MTLGQKESEPAKMYFIIEEEDRNTLIKIESLKTKQSYLIHIIISPKERELL
jgi:hypothetical protein